MLEETTAHQEIAGVGVLVEVEINLLASSTMVARLPFSSGDQGPERRTDAGTSMTSRFGIYINNVVKARSESCTRAMPR